MARPSRKSPTKIATMRSMQADGKSQREIAEAIGVGVGTVSSWLKSDVGAGGDRAKVKPAPSDVETAAALLGATLPSPDEPGAIVQVRERARLIQGLLERLAPAVEDEEYPATSFVTLARYGDDLARVQAELTPPAPKDPNDDPDVIEAEKVLIARLTKLVTEAEKRA